MLFILKLSKSYAQSYFFMAWLGFICFSGEKYDHFQNVTLDGYSNQTTAWVALGNLSFVSRLTYSHHILLSLKKVLLEILWSWFSLRSLVEKKLIWNEIKITNVHFSVIYALPKIVKYCLKCSVKYVQRYNSGGVGWNSTIMVPP